MGRRRGQYRYLQAGGYWRGELGLHTALLKPNTAPDKVWQLRDLYGHTLYFNADGRPTRKQDKDGSDANTWTWRYDNGEPVELTGSTGRTQSFTVDGNHKITAIRVRNPAPDTGPLYDYAYEYNDGRLTAATLVTNSAEFSGDDPAKRVRVSYGYDAASGRLNRITTPEGAIYQIAYDGLGRVTAIDLPDPSTGAASTCGRAHCWEFRYAPGAGWGETTVTDPRGHAWAYRALGSGPVWKLTDPLGKSVRRTWTATNNLARETDKLGNVWEFAYDVNGNRLEISEPINGSLDPTSFTYNDDNRRTSKTDARGHTTTYTYTADKDLDVETDPEGGRVDHDYNQYRELVRVVDARDGVTTLTYDRHGQVATKDWPDGTRTTYSRDAWGRAVEVGHGLGSPTGPEDKVTRITYDDLGRVTETRLRMSADPTANEGVDLLTYATWNRDGHPRTATDPNGGVTTTTADKRGRVVAVEGPPGNGAAAAEARPCAVVAYDQAGHAVETRRAHDREPGAVCALGASGLDWSTVRRTYDPRGLVIEERLVDLNAAEYADGAIWTTWEHDPNGRVIRSVDALGRSVEIGYDDLGRKQSAEAAVTLTGVTGPGCHGIAGAVCSTARWEYDAVGNVTREVTPRGSGASQADVSRTTTYDKVQRPLSRTDELGKVWRWTWDRGGNKLSESLPIAGQTWRWEYDSLSRVVAALNPRDDRATQTYDRHGRVTTTTDRNGQTTRHTWDKADRLVAVRTPWAGSAASGMTRTATGPHCRTRADRSRRPATTR